MQGARHQMNMPELQRKHVHTQCKSMNTDGSLPHKECKHQTDESITFHDSVLLLFVFLVSSEISASRISTAVSIVTQSNKQAIP